MSSATNDNKLLKDIAVVIVENPRSNMKDLAESVGISKATLHRLYGTRENLESILMKKASESVEDIISICERDFNDYSEGIRLLIQSHYENKEFLTFICGYQYCVEDKYWSNYFKAIDKFFLNGQKSGEVRIDVSVSALTELFIASFSGMIDAERRGRVASSSMLETLENFFLYGSLNK
ncbi:winged helix-turn-helix domain-containing protein [Clostridium botulinum]|uniref:winged helix-turn-helix domain-containing protein n=1 Tax=Clostridium botulinum TaxID=1491 RepID=UPI0005978522|nr:winged helix-turn-helix domain-containing protein [Clostridium botulinum]KIL07529.1 transcriptional regulator NfxB [Clostridium botulinum]MBY6809255.1 winged helix-turn-helix transcriptional regulator [Clostridium botulinum]MBY6822697.1 winged helix-turn-helix transcriptional regulator [Clostridium botulinum]MBY6833309.1 winged helix-turn-helix transcriptional regulator [Clostridium botulinum]MBY6935411.1 winged helix-turn-helix transcriptional regulator [Clostridium botulinum]